MDIKLIGINGIEATRKIRDFNADIPIIAQTALMLRDELNQMMEAGFNNYILKPIEQHVLMEKITKLS
jgi:CheY-like chemotaxis protein